MLSRLDSTDIAWVSPDDTLGVWSLTALVGGVAEPGLGGRGGDDFGGRAGALVFVGGAVGGVEEGGVLAGSVADLGWIRVISSLHPVSLSGLNQLSVEEVVGGEEGEEGNWCWTDGM